MPALRARSRAYRLRTFPPTAPMNAGTRVSATSMAIATTVAAARPSEPTNVTPAMYSPRMEITTVLPATTTAAPEVLSARFADVATSRPASMFSRCLAVRKSP